MFFLKKIAISIGYVLYVFRPFLMVSPLLISDRSLDMETKSSPKICSTAKIRKWAVECPFEAKWAYIFEVDLASPSSLCFSIALRCSLPRSISVRLVFPMYCGLSWHLVHSTMYSTFFVLQVRWWWMLTWTLVAERVNPVLFKECWQVEHLLQVFHPAWTILGGFLLSGTSYSLARHTNSLTLRCRLCATCIPLPKTSLIWGSCVKLLKCFCRTDAIDGNLGS